LCLLKPRTPSKSPTIYRNLAEASDNDDIDIPEPFGVGAARSDVR